MKNPFKKKVESGPDGTCVWITPVGSIQLRTFKIIGKKEDKIKIDFGNNEVYIIKKDNIRAKRVMIYKTEDGSIHVQNPNNWKNIDLKKYKIKELRFNLQNFALQEGKSAIHRWTVPLDRIARLAPLFKLLFICIAIGVMGWGAFKFGVSVLDVVMSSRTLSCSSVLPKAQVPLGVVAEVVKNVTVPLGV
jgi:hypothetical protein